MAKLQSILVDGNSNAITLLLAAGKKTISPEEVSSIKFLPASWFSIHRVSKTQRTNYIRNLIVLTIVCATLTFIVGGPQLPPLVIFYYLLILALGIMFLIMAPKKSNKLEIKSLRDTIILDHLTQLQVSKIYQALKSRIVSSLPDKGPILETKVVRNKIITGLSVVLSSTVLFLVMKMEIGTIHLILLFFYALLLSGSLAFNVRYQPKIIVSLTEKGLLFDEREGKYSNEEHLIEVSMIERVVADSSFIIGLVRKSRTLISSNSEKKESGIFHFNRKDLHFFHQAYLPLKEYKFLSPFFMDWLNEELLKKKEEKRN